MTAVPARPRIGLSANLADPDPDRPFYPPFTLTYAEESMAALFTTHGALVYMVTVPVDSPAAPSVAEIVDDLDGLVLTGGADVAPDSYGQQPREPQWAGQARRDAYELALVRQALAVGVPVLGICRGHQLLNVALGGTLLQDIATQTSSPVVHRHQQHYHRNRHHIEVVAGSSLAAIAPADRRASVNSIHHQAIDALAPGLVVEAVCPDDGIIEAVRLEGCSQGSQPWAVGVQWHPEFDAPAAADGGLPADHLDVTPLVHEFLATARHRQEMRRG